MASRHKGGVLSQKTEDSMWPFHKVKVESRKATELVGFFKDPSYFPTFIQIKLEGFTSVDAVCGSCPDPNSKDIIDVSIVVVKLLLE